MHFIELKDVVKVIECGRFLIEEIIHEMSVPVSIKEHGLHTDGFIQVFLGLFDLSEFTEYGTAATEIKRPGPDSDVIGKTLHFFLHQLGKG